MPSDARPKTLGDYFTLQRGVTYDSRLLDQPGPPLLGLGTIERNGGFRSDSMRTYGGKSSDKLLVQPGELYVSLKDVTQSADLLGAVARLPHDQPPGRLTQDTVKLQPKVADAPMEYLYWLLRTPQYRSHCRSHGTGTTNLDLAREDFLSFPAPEPSPVQRKIVSTLTALAEKIDLNERMNRTLDALARTLFKSWFVQFGPVRAKADGRSTGLSASLDAAFPSRLVDSGSGEIPDGWALATLADFASLNPEAWSKATRPDVINYVDLSNTKWGRIEAVATYEQERAPSRAQRVLRPGDTIVGTVRPGNGSYALVSDAGLTGSTGFAVLRPIKAEHAEYVYCAATAPENIALLLHLADGAAYPAVRPDVIAATPVVRADDSIVATYSRRTQPLLARMAANERDTRNLVTMRDTLLATLISSDQGVEHAENFVGAVN